ncbi:putative uncharacterized protein DDB_G0286901 [Limulus polyphemus]|uniref:Uncharacterized protein n=1 Tax=Limulus polyphemus TaxID=6850 RepID=A0ABM1S1F9_LIMPO|nr:putative uncharacterized protein DDB_G0286901 [Limulus polyphemus]
MKSASNQLETVNKDTEWDKQEMSDSFPWDNSHNSITVKSTSKSIQSHRKNEDTSVYNAQESYHSNFVFTTKNSNQMNYKNNLMNDKPDFRIKRDMKSTYYSQREDQINQTSHQNQLTRNKNIYDNNNKNLSFLLPSFRNKTPNVENKMMLNLSNKNISDAEDEMSSLYSNVIKYGNQTILSFSNDPSHTDYKNLTLFDSNSSNLSNKYVSSDIIPYSSLIEKITAVSKGLFTVLSQNQSNIPGVTNFVFIKQVSNFSNENILPFLIKNDISLLNNQTKTSIKNTVVAKNNILPFGSNNILLLNSNTNILAYKIFFSSNGNIKFHKNISYSNRNVTSPSSNITSIHSHKTKPFRSKATKAGINTTSSFSYTTTTCCHATKSFNSKDTEVGNNITSFTRNTTNTLDNKTKTHIENTTLVGISTLPNKSSRNVSFSPYLNSSTDLEVEVTRRNHPMTNGSSNATEMLPPEFQNDIASFQNLLERVFGKL